MKKKNKSIRSTIILLALLFLLVNSSVLAGTVQIITDGDSSHVPGWNTEIGFVAEGRNAASGDNTWELGLGSRTDQAGSFSQDDYTWSNGGSNSFTLTMSNNDATFKVRKWRQCPFLPVSGCYASVFWAWAG
jgi:hypothetical protein